MARPSKIAILVGKQFKVEYHMKTVLQLIYTGLGIKIFIFKKWLIPYDYLFVTLI